MIQVADYTSSVRETKSVRKGLRMKPSVVKTIERAASSVGMDVSTFVSSAAYEAAQKVEQSQFQTNLNREDFEAFTKAVERVGRPNDALSELFELRSGLLKDE